MLKRFCRWVLSGELIDEYLRGVRDGIDQERIDPESSRWHITLDEDGEPI